MSDIIHTEGNSASKELFQLNVTMAIGETYYVRATRHFNLANSDYKSELIPVTNNGEQISNMLLQHDIVIEEPTVYITRANLEDKDNPTVVKTSKFRGKGDGHTHTHWIITDSRGKIIYIKLYDAENKTELTIPDTVPLLGKNKLSFRAIHCSNNIESGVGKKDIVFNQFNFEITSPLLNVPINQNHVIKIEKVNLDKPNGIARVAIIDAPSGEVLNAIDISEPTEVEIPQALLIAENTLYIDIYAYDESNVYSKARHELRTVPNTFGETHDDSYEYDKEISGSKEDTTIVFADGVVTTELLNNTIPVPVKGSTKLHLCKYDVDNSELISLNDTVTGIDLPNGDTDDIYINYIDRDYLIVDTLDITNIPIFLVFKHNVEEDTYTLLRSKIRTGETRPMGKTNAIVQINRDEFIYLPYGSNKLMKYNVETNDLTELNTVPMEEPYSGNLFKLIDGRIMIMAGTSHTTKIYRVDENDFVDSISVTPSTFIGEDYKTVELINRDVIIFKTGEILGDPDNSVLYFDRSTNEMSELPIKFNPGEFAKTSLSLLTGEVLLTNFLAGVPEINTVDRTLIKTFK